MPELDAALLHRYALAAQLCAGLRVLDAGGAPEGAALVAAQGATVRLALADDAALADADRHPAPGVLPELAAPADAIRRADRTDADAVLSLHGGVPDPAELTRLAAGGVKLLVAVTGDRRPLQDVPGVRWLHQHLAEGSVLAAADAGDPLAGHVELLGVREPDAADAHLACVGFDASVLDRASARLQVVATPVVSRRIRELERAVTQLERANRELARGIYGKHDAASAAAAAAYDAKVDELENRSWILGEEKKQAEARAKQLQAWHDAGRYHAVDQAVEVVKRVPALHGAIRTARRVVRRARPRD